MGEKHDAYFTFDERAAAEGHGHFYYFAPANRATPPYRKQIHVEAIIDIADDGTLAGVELIDTMPPPPTASPDTASVVSEDQRQQSSQLEDGS